MDRQADAVDGQPENMIPSSRMSDSEGIEMIESRAVDD